MDGPNDDLALDASAALNKAAVRKMLADSRRDIAEGRVVPLAPVLDRMRAVADGIRLERTDSMKAARQRR